MQIRSEIIALHQRLRTTTICVTHDQIEAMTMADAILVMQDGQVKQMDAPLELYDRPANRFVASCIGSPVMNFFDGRIEDDRLVTTPPQPSERFIRTWSDRLPDYELLALLLFNAAP